MDILKNFGSRIREIRIREKISQEELAFKSGLHRTYIGAIERGEKNISLKNIEKLANGLGVEINQFFKELIK